MSILWRDTRPGDVGRVGAVDLDGEGAVMIHDGIPDWVRVPDGVHTYAGESRRVVGFCVDRCPHFGCEYLSVQHLRLEGAGGLSVACCPDHGFSFIVDSDMSA